MKINNITFNTDLETILVELRNQLSANNILLLQKMKSTSTHVMVQCPYHNNGQERRPSAGIRKSDGVFHCFACGEVHSLREVISYCFGHTDDVVGAFGWQWLLKNFATVAVEERKDVALDFYRNDKFSGDSNRTNYVTEEELAKYRYIHPYMYKRKLNDTIIDIFDVGYDSVTKCITFPVRDINGNCVFVARRSVKTKWFNYPAGAEKPVYGLYELYNLNNFPSEVIICESMIDALTCWVYGKYAVALNGLGNELQFKQLREMPCRKFILGTDNDTAGRKARFRIRKNIANKLITEYLLPPNRKDINELSKAEFDSLREVF